MSLVELQLFVFFRDIVSRCTNFMVECKCIDHCSPAGRALALLPCDCPVAFTLARFT